MPKCNHITREGKTATNSRMADKQHLQHLGPRRARDRHPELILAFLLAELSSGHSHSRMSSLGSPTGQSRLAAEMLPICHPRINLLSEINLSNWSRISNNNAALPGRGQGPQGMGHRRGAFHDLNGSLREG